MAKATKSKQLSFSLPNKVGQLCNVTCALAGAKVNIEAICAYGMGRKAYFMLIADNTAKAKNALAKELRAKAVVEDVIFVEMPNRVGALEKVAEKIAEAGIDIYYVYGCPGKGGKGVLVLKTENDRKALKVI